MNRHNRKTCPVCKYRGFHQPLRDQTGPTGDYQCCNCCDVFCGKCMNHEDDCKCNLKPTTSPREENHK